jgi:spermidine/putrescine transport system ATP-binding protein
VDSVIGEPQAHGGIARQSRQPTSNLLTQPATDILPGQGLPSQGSASQGSASGAGEVIALRNVSRRYGELVALEDLSLAIGAGEFFSLLGPSGCGKTTMLRLIAGFDRPQAGRILLQGRDLTEAPPHRRPVNLVFQNYALFPHLSVWDNIAFGPRSQRLPEPEIRRRVGESLEVVRLSELARRRPHQLSGGQQQRVALARALVNAPAALLLDEPLAALDPDLRRTMRSELKRIQREVGITFLLVTHDREEALSLSDRLAVLHAGRLEQVGTPRQLYDQPRSAVVATFLGGANLLPDSSGAGLRVLRPERLRLRSSPPQDGELGLLARVRELAFQGATVEVRLSGAADLQLIAIDTSAALPDNLRIGAEIWCCWNPADSHLLEASLN